jgi:uncharacterized protein DUF6703
VPANCCFPMLDEPDHERDGDFTVPKRKPQRRRPASGPARAPGARGHTRRPPTASSEPPVSQLRRRVERLSYRPIVQLAQSPPWVLPLLVGGAALVGLLLGGIAGAVLLALATVIVLWLTAATVMTAVE